MNQNYITAGLVVITVVVIWYFFFYVGSYDSFAQCLNQKGVKFYGAFWCPHCKAEKELFGNSFRLINYIECSNPDMKSQTKACIDAKIESYPTWVFANGSRLAGEIPFDQLSKMTGCPVTSS